MSNWQQRAVERQTFADELAAKHLPGWSSKVTDHIFRMAWEEGHASGLNEVEQWYIDLADLASLAYDEGVIAGQA